jgi:hypothetical protein
MNGGKTRPAEHASGAAARRVPARLPADAPPHLLVVVDTEEEFDWSAGFDRDATHVEAMSHQHHAQQICEGAGVCPTYVVDYPVAGQEAGYRPIGDWISGGTAVVGAHLHPWVSPPFEEEVCPHNSFPGNLPHELEAAKLSRLTECIEDSFGVRPTIYKAGRYGFGSNTPAILAELDFEVDLSANPPFDYRAEGGPDYSRHSADPCWHGAPGRLLGIPGSGGYVGWLGSRSHRVYSWAARPALAWSRLPGVLSRVGAVDRLRISPEGYEAGEMKRLTRHLLRRGTRVFTFSYHSPSLLPGCTPYVRSRSDLDRFLDRFKSYFEFFLGELGGVATTPLDLRRKLETVEAPPE